MPFGVDRGVSRGFSLIIAGVGGQGVVYAGRLIARAVFMEGRYVSLRYTYGAEVTGTPVYSEVRVDSKPIVSPYIEKADVALVMHAKSLKGVVPKLSPHSLLVIDESISPPTSLKVSHIYRKPFIARASRGAAGELGRLGTLAAVGFLARLGLARLDLLIEAAREGRDPEATVEALRLGFTL